MLDHLMTPLRVGPVELPNRIAFTAHQTSLVRGNVPTPEFIAYHEARAAGGAGLIVLEATPVDPSASLSSDTLAGFSEDVVDGYRALSDAVRAHGTKLFVQLFHGGRGLVDPPPRSVAVAPSAVPSPRFHVEPRALREAEIERLVSNYARAAALAADGGFDGIEVTAGHSYLIAQFFVPGLNRRTDRWAEPSAFLVAVLDAVRAAAPGLAVGVRLTAGPPEYAEMARTVAQRVDFLHVAIGDSSSLHGSTGVVPPPPVPENVVAELTRPFRLGVPLIATSRVVDPAHADRIVACGQADAVGMTRALIADPDLPRKAAAGDADRVVRCIGCNACIGHALAGSPIACVVNPRTGREGSWVVPGAVADGRSFVVVGGGPAGLAAAAELVALGHRVTVLERGSATGGQAALVAGTPGGAEMSASLRRNFSEMLSRGEVEVRLGVEADPELVAGLGAEAVIVATGARPFWPDLALDGVVVRHAWEVLADRASAPRRVVVADWGGDSSGLDATEVLRAAGSEVTLVSSSVAVGEEIHQYRRNLYLERLYRAGVQVVQHFELAGASGGMVRFVNVFAPDVTMEFEAQLLVVALGRVPADELAPALAARGLAVFEAGDCRAPRSLEEAILEGTLAARQAAGIDDADHLRLRAA